MIDKALLELAQNRAAQVASEAYATHIVQELEALGIPEAEQDLAELLDGENHIHEAILHSKGKRILLRNHWSLSAHPAVVEAAFDRAEEIANRG